MRNYHIFRQAVEIRCPYKNCGQTHIKTMTVEYITNQKGDVIESRVV